MNAFVLYLDLNFYDHNAAFIIFENTTSFLYVFTLSLDMNDVTCSFMHFNCFTDGVAQFWFHFNLDSGLPKVQFW